MIIQEQRLDSAIAKLEKITKSIPSEHHVLMQSILMDLRQHRLNLLATEQHRRMVKEFPLNALRNKSVNQNDLMYEIVSQSVYESVGKAASASIRNSAEDYAREIHE